MKSCMLILIMLCTMSCASAPIQSPGVRPIAFHTCVPGATVWLTGAQVPPLQGPTCVDGKCATDENGNLAVAEFPAELGAFNVHATADGYPEYGAVIEFTPSTEPLVVILGSCAK